MRIVDEGALLFVIDFSLYVALTPDRGFPQPLIFKDRISIYVNWIMEQHRLHLHVSEQKLAKSGT